MSYIVESSIVPTSRAHMDSQHYSIYCTHCILISPIQKKIQDPHGHDQVFFNYWQQLWMKIKVDVF